MDDKIFDGEYSRYLNAFLNYAEQVFSSVKTNSELAEAMKYSFFAGGKRIRPVLMLACAEKLNGNYEKVLPFAFSLEATHTYSLVHDDLPALDNDVLRRGKPTCHVKYGEATAVLAGDGLLNLAFEHVLSVISGEREITAARALAEYSGCRGMLGGQASDIEHEKSADCSVETLNEIYALKTGKFLTLPFLIPSIIYAPDLSGQALAFGEKFGRFFQFADDLSDVVLSSKETGKSAGKDEKSGKLTAVKVYGLSGVKECLIKLSDELQELSKPFINSAFFQCFIKRVTKGLL